MCGNFLKSERRHLYVMAFVILFVFFSFFINSPFSLLVGTLVVGIYSISDIIQKPVSRNVLVFLLLFSMFIIPVFLALNHGFSVFFYYVSTVFCFFAARKMVSIHRCLVLQAYQFSFYFLFFIFIFLYYIYRDEAEPFGAIIEGASTNGVPSYFIVLQVTLSLIAFSINGRLPLLSAAMTFFIAVLGIGRGAILAAFAIFAFSFLFNFCLDVKYKRTGRVLGVIGFVAVLFFVFCFSYDAVFEYFYARTNLSRGLYDSARVEMISDYVGGISAIGLFAGSSFDGTVIAELYGNNPHNSFIRSHSYMGLGVFLMVLFSPFLFFFSRVKFSAKIAYFSLVMILFFRAFSEPILFPTLLDIFYFVIFLFFFKGQAVRRPTVLHNKGAVLWR
ncbi:hypothetical protein SAMN05216194_11032 [Stutzerimonas kunmingensis]|uniref:hypothetical protein n=1 Tax=Stutzerimonas kunmingensis TaxID=1211807 RepID=UPI0008E4720F|nr:hypothetical protein [Stutzerimonas kunmingensis]MCQ2044487.1 hypothetical protein [Stutzerimonas kunmingensis]SFJ99506.1 hypothetical protein SAMN05216194_11032 [Stutzerimonas kunmingensis]